MKRLSAIFLTLAILLSVTGCQQKTPTTRETEMTEHKTVYEPESQSEKEPEKESEIIIASESEEPESESETQEETESAPEENTESESEPPESQPESENQPEEPKESEPETKSNLGDYRVVPLKVELDKDWEGKKIAVVTYEFTNNSDENNSFSFAVSAKVFQNGVELSDSYFNDVDSENHLKEIKPGVTIKVQCAYELEDTSPIEIEIEELFSFGDKKVCKTFELK